LRGQLRPSPHRFRALRPERCVQHPSGLDRAADSRRRIPSQHLAGRPDASRTTGPGAGDARSVLMSTRAPTAASLPPLDSEQLQRYARHLTLPQFGVEGQQKLAAARVLLIGAGGLGSPAALYLAAAGVGTVGIIDHDVVDISHLQRQVLHGTSALGIAKTSAAAARLAVLNPHVKVVEHHQRISAAIAREVISGYDVVVDGSDNFPTRYLVNDACVLTGTPLVYGSIYRFEGQLSLFVTPGGPCYRCLFAEPPAPELVPSCADA